MSGAKDIVEKSELRALFKNRIAGLSVQERNEQSYAIVVQLTEFLQDHQGVWALYSPLNDEPNLTALLQACSHIDWVFPKVESKTEIKFRRVDSLDQLVTGAWGLHEPAQKPSVPKDEIAGTLIPGLAYDHQGVRLGRGGGYYDRFLWNFKGLKLGVTFNEGLTVETLPRESHDQLMNTVVSPQKWVDVKQSEVSYV